MLSRVITWAVHNPLVVLLLAGILAAAGGLAFVKVNVEAYPDPAPAIVEVIAQYPGASAEEVERQVAIPLEITFAGMPKLKYTRSRSLFGLAHLRLQFEYGYSYADARQEVINRLQFTEPLPPGVTGVISPSSPTGEIYRYTLTSPKDARGNEVYSLNDLKALQDWTLEREFRRVDRIVDVSSAGGTVKRYELHPDPDRLRRYGVTLGQFQAAVANANQNSGGDVLMQGANALNVRSVGLIGGGQDPMQSKAVFAAPDPSSAALLLRTEDDRRVKTLRQIVVTSVNNSPVRVEDLVDGGPLEYAQQVGQRGVVVGHQTRLGRVSLSNSLRSRTWDRLSPEERTEALAQTGLSEPWAWERTTGLQPANAPSRYRWWREGGRWERRPADAKPWGKLSDTDKEAVRATFPKQSEGERTNWWFYPRPGGGWEGWDDERWADEEEKVQCIVLLRKGEDSLPALNGVHDKVKELNDPASGRMLPGVKIEPYYDRTELIGLTTETVRENLVLGMVLVTMILLMFLGNVRVALIVAVNIPLALLFAFAVLYARGKSANLLSIGAVDFGIIVDSSVIMAENIFRKLTSGEHVEESLVQRILRSAGEIRKPLLFSTAIMVCAFIPLFTMQGAEGQLFGPMADTYAFALGGALCLAAVLTPVLCRLFLRSVKPARDNLLVRVMKWHYLRNVRWALNLRWLFLVVMGGLIVGTAWAAAFGVPQVGVNKLGREFMPELEEGNLWVRGMYPRNVGLDTVADGSRQARAVMRKYPEVEAVANQMGRPDDGTDPEGFYKSEFFVPLRPRSEWPAVQPASGWQSWLGEKRPRTKAELIAEMTADLRAATPGVDWNFSQNIRDNVMESISGVKGDNSVKIYGPDLKELQRLAKQVEAKLREVPGVEDVGVMEVMGQPNLDIPWDAEKCQKWGVSVNDLQTVVQTSVGGQPFSTMIEGEKKFDITLRWPKPLRDSEQAILDIPVDILNNQVSGGYQAQLGQNRGIGAGVGLATAGTANPNPALTGSQFNAVGNYIASTPRRRLGDLVTPLDADGTPAADGSFVRPGASMIFREQGKRMIAVKFGVRGRDLAGAVDEAKAKVAEVDDLKPPYRTEWSGEFEQMQDAEARMMVIIPLALLLIFGLLYMAFKSLLDAVVVLSNVVALSLGGIWALLLTGTNFSTSAAVGFVSLFGVAIMDGLLMVSYFNALRAHGVPLRDAILQGAEKRVRPVVMTCMTAILGLLPAALAVRPAWDDAGSFRLIEPIGVQTQRPLAIVVVGGMIATLLLTRYLMPVLYSFYGHRSPPSGAGDLAH